MKSIKLTLNYKSGKALEQIVNYVHFEEAAIYFTVKKQIHNVFEEPVRIPLENLESFEIEETEKEWN